MSDPNIAGVLGYLERIAQALEAHVVLLERISRQQGAQEMESIYRDRPAGSDPDFIAALAAEVEGRIQGAATPKVSRHVVVDESGAYEVQDSIRVNLLKQPRTELTKLKELLPPGDKQNPILTQLLGKDTIDTVLLAAVEIVFSNIPVDMWDSVEAQKQIAALVAMHDPEGA